MSVEVTKCQLSKICTDVSYGYTESANPEKVGPRFLRITDIQGGVVNWNDVPYCPIDDDKIDKYLLLVGDIVVARTGNSTGENYAYKGQDPSVFASYLIRFRVDKDKANPFFVWYQMRTQRWWDFVAGVKGGSAQAGANAKVLGTYDIFLPDLKIQNYIANQFENIDSKIQLNRQVNQTLEEIAQAIFKSWFVDFEPVKAKIEAKVGGQDPERAAMCAISGKTDAELDLLPPDQLAQLRATAALFPDELTDSELGLIPAGWKAGSIGDVAAAKGGYAYKSKVFTEVGHPVVKIKNIVGDGTVNLDECQCIDDDQGKATSRFNLSDGDLLMAMTGATVGKVGLVVLSGRTAYLNQRVAKFESGEFGPGISWFLFCAFQRESIFEQVVGTAQGSAQPNISSKGIESTKLVVPSNGCLREFIAKAEPLFLKWMSNQNEIKNLASIRDTLLPKLLSGEIELGPAPISS